MKSLAALCIKRPVFASMLILCLVVVGTASYGSLGVDRFPAVDLPTVFVRTQLPGASPEEVEVLISQPIEEAVNQVEPFGQCGLDRPRPVRGLHDSVPEVAQDGAQQLAVHRHVVDHQDAQRPRAFLRRTRRRGRQSDQPVPRRGVAVRQGPEVSGDTLEVPHRNPRLQARNNPPTTLAMYERP